MSSLSELISRLEAATGPDRGLDALIAKHVAGLNFGWCNGEDWTCGVPSCPGCGEPLGLVDERKSYPSDWREDERLLHYTGSTDAALALAERVLPGWEVEQISFGNGLVFVSIGNFGDGDAYAAGLGEHTTAPLAIVLATLLALQSSEQSNADGS